MSINNNSSPLSGGYSNVSPSSSYSSSRRTQTNSSGSVPRKFFPKSTASSATLTPSPSHIKSNSSKGKPNNWSRPNKNLSLSSPTIKSHPLSYSGNLTQHLDFPELGPFGSRAKNENQYLASIISQNNVNELIFLIKDNYNKFTPEETVASIEQLNVFKKNYYKKIKDSQVIKILIQKCLLNNSGFNIEQSFRIFRCKVIRISKAPESIRKINFLFDKLFLSSPINFKEMKTDDLVLFMTHLCSNPKLMTPYKKGILEQIATELCQCEDFTPAQISHVTKIFAATETLNLPLFAHLEKLALEQKEKFQSKEMGLLLWSYVYLGIKSSNLLEQFAQTIDDKLISKLSSKNIINILWSYIVFKPNFDVLPFFKRLMEKDDETSRIDLNQLTPKHITQLYQIHAACAALKIQGKIVWPDRFTTVRASHQTESHESDLQKKATEIIKNLNIAKDWKSEYRFGPFSIDLYAPAFSLAVEIDGPNHFVIKDHRFGKDALRDWILKEKGIEVLRIPYYELPLGNDEKLKTVLFDKINASIDEILKRDEAVEAAKDASSLVESNQ